ncbi:MAG: FAD:protein FMN transferase [Victivallaceae bacterium]|nr:FAD:protein FMN transferase [Victivallaceae bacterium]
MTENSKNRSEKPETEQDKIVLSKRRTRNILGMIGLAGIVYMLLFPRQSADSKAPAPTINPVVAERTFPVMGTIAQYKLYGDEKLVEQAADKVRDAFFEVDKLCNIFNAQSEISQLNRTAADRPFKCSPLLWAVLMQSKRAYELSGGAFDITARPLMKLWGFYRKRGDSLPTAAEIANVLKKIGMDKVIFDESARTVKFTQPGISFDLGGVAKGFAVDQAVIAVKKLGIKSGIINLAGNMYCFPEPFPRRKTYRIGIKNPQRKDKLCGYVDLLNSSLATSGDYERYVTIQGKRYTHIMDVRTGKPVTGMLSVTVITPSACVADYLSTSIFINGKDFAGEICKKIPGTQVLIIQENANGKPEQIKFGTSWKLD